jgi:DNA-cytosine methyltransferase
MSYQPYLMADVRSASERRLFTVVSMFAGGGGSSIGYRLAGGQVPLVNEFVREAARTYSTNFPDTLVDGRDIRTFHWKKRRGKHVGAEEFIAQIGLCPGELDLLDGSPPCTEFSRAGRGLADPAVMKKHSDRKQKGAGMLFYDFLHVVKRVKPRVFVAENVPDLASARSKDLFQDFVDAARNYRTPGSEKERGYYCNWSVLNSADFGVPQARKRLFLVGVRKDVAESVGIGSDDDIRNLFPTPVSQQITVGQAFEGLRNDLGEEWAWTLAMMRSGQYRDVRLLPRNPDRVIRLRHIGIEGRNWNLIRCAWGKPALTLTCSGQKPSSGLGGCLHPQADRKFTLPELKRLFGLPDDYLLTGTLDQAAERVGNMVAPLVIKALAESIYQKVLRPHRERITGTLN